MNAKTFLSLVVLIVASLASGVFGGRWYERQQQSFAPDESGSLARSGNTKVHALGRLEPHTRIIEVGATQGSRLDRLTVTEGDVVMRGSVLAHLDAHDERAAARDYAAAELAEAKQLLAVETRVGQAVIELAKLKLQVVREVLPLEIDARKAALERAAVEWEDAQVELERITKAAASKTVTASEFDHAKFAARRAEQTHRSTELTLQQLRRDQELKLKIGEVELRQAEAAQTKQELTTRVDSLRAALDLAESQFQRTIVLAPVDGQILQVLVREGEGVAGPILKMGDTAAMQVRAEVYETDVRQIRPGQTAVVTSRAFDQELTGRIIHIGSLVHRNDIFNVDPTAEVDARVVEVRIALDDSSTAAKYVQHQVHVAIDVETSPTNDSDQLSPQL